MAGYEAAILPQEYNPPVSSVRGEYGPPPPKPAHGRPRTDYSDFMMEYATYHINDRENRPPPQTDIFPFRINHRTGLDEQELNKFLPHQLQDDRYNETNVIRRKGSANRKKFVHFRESRDVTYYPELYQAEKVYPENEPQSPPPVLGHAYAASPPTETTPFRGMSEDAHLSSDMIVTVDHGHLGDSDRTGNDHLSYRGGHTNKTVSFDRHADNLRSPSPLEEKHFLREEEFAGLSSHERMTTVKGKWSARQRDTEIKQETSKYSEPQPSVKICESEVATPGNEMKVSAIGPVYLINRNSAKRSSGTFISLIGCLPVDHSKPKDSKIYHCTFAKEAAIRKQTAKELKETSSATQESNREVRADTGYLVQEEGDIEMKEYKNTFSTPDSQRIRNSASRFRQQFEELYHEAEATLKTNTVRESGPEVRNTIRIKRDSNDPIVYHKKKDELCDDSENRPEVRASPSTTIQKSYREKESADQVDASGFSIGISCRLDTKTPPQGKPARAHAEKDSESNTGFHRKNVKNLSVNIMGVSSESLDATEQSPYYERHSTINSPYNKTSIIHKDPVDPNMSLVCGDGPAVLIENDYSSSYIVIVAIDFGTMFSGYAFSFTRDPESIHMMRKWEGGDPGINNQKAPTSILITPDGEFDSFGYAARDHYHDLDATEAKEYLYFEKFKMALHHNADLSKDTMLEATNGKSMLAITVFSYALRFFKEHALQELSDQSGVKIVNDDVRWVITVPAIWKAPAKQFMRQAAYQAGIASSLNPEQLIISLEPEAASVYCRKLRLYQLIPDSPVVHPLTSPNKKTPEILNMDLACSDLIHGMRYMVVDCGGGTVDITVHELEKDGLLRELYKATGGAYGGTGVDMEFEKLLNSLFGKKFIDQFKAERPVGWMDLMIAFESRKRSASPHKNTPLNISLPFAFIDYYKKIKKCHVEAAIKKYNDKNVRWSTQGMLRLSPEVMQSLFQPTLIRIGEAIGNVLNNPDAKDLKYLFLVGGFAESPMLQHFVRQEFGFILKVIIPQGVGLSILKGAVLYGQDPSVVSIRRCRMTYGVGVLNKYDENKHPKEKLFTKDGMNWCSDVFDKFVVIDQPIRAGDTVVRSYTPAKIDQKLSIINIYASDKEDVQFITDSSVRKCGNLSLDLSTENPITPTRREIQTIMSFGDTEIRMTALDVLTGKSVKSTIDFLE